MWSDFFSLVYLQVCVGSRFYRSVIPPIEGNKKRSIHERGFEFFLAESRRKVYNHIFREMKE